eukprot:g40007.t1
MDGESGVARGLACSHSGQNRSLQDVQPSRERKSHPQMLLANLIGQQLHHAQQHQSSAVGTTGSAGKSPRRIMAAPKEGVFKHGFCKVSQTPDLLRVQHNKPSFRLTAA